ncbi:MAG TPA: hypothetical protein VK674_05620 [Candidatus Limnocylindria bacterium]|nr:hypothetical protein [Candidatus Limnocylindria bacterium]
MIYAAKNIGAQETPFRLIKILPNGQERISLGTYSANKPPKGFKVTLSPEPDLADSVVTAMTSLGSRSNYELILHVSNFGGRAATAKVWEL